MFWFDSFRNSCLFSRHSWSNHFLLDVLLIRLRNLLILILRHIFDVAVRMFTASSNETFTSSEFRSIYSLIRIWIGSVHNVFLNFKYESFSQQNCRGKRSKLLVEFKVWVSLAGKLVLRFNHATIALW